MDSENLKNPTRTDLMTTSADDKTDNRTATTTTMAFLTDDEDIFHDVFDENSFLGNPILDAMNRIVSHAMAISKKLPENKSVTKANKLEAIKHADSIKKLAEMLITNIKENPDNLSIPIPTPQTLNKEAMVAIQNTIKTTLKEYTNINPNQLNQKQTYATITNTTNKSSEFPSLRTSDKPKKSNPALLVTINGSTSKEESRKIWREEISFRKEKYLPTKISPIKDDKLKIEFETNEQLNNTIHLIKQSKSNKLSAEKINKLQPMFILKGIPKTVDSKDLTTLLINQNNCLEHLDPKNTEPHLKLCFLRSNKNNNLYNAVFRASPEIWQKVLEAGRINVDHSRVHAGEHVAILHCFKCLQYGHTKNKCTSEQHNCSHCASSLHSYENCSHKSVKSVVKCFSCIKNNTKFNKSNPINHSATSNQCPIKQAIAARTINNTDYGTK